MDERTHANGGVAQLGEHLLCKQGVIGSNPFISTSVESHAAKSHRACGEGKPEDPVTNLCVNRKLIHGRPRSQIA